jgi:muconolactone delta-isomerase
MISVQDGVVRLDDHGVAALLGGEDPDPDAVGELQRAGLGPALETLRQPLVTVDVLVAGTSTQLHRAGVDAERAVVLLAVRPGLHQLMVLPPSHLAAALVRMTRTGPRRASASEPRSLPADAAERLLSTDDAVRHEALREAGAALAWRLRVGWAGEHRDLVVVDGPDGAHVVDDEAGALLPVSATSLYRVFATALPPGALEPAG